MALRMGLGSGVFGRGATVGSLLRRSRAIQCAGDMNDRHPPQQAWKYSSPTVWTPKARGLQTVVMVMNLNVKTKTVDPNLAAVYGERLSKAVYNEMSRLRQEFAHPDGNQNDVAEVPPEDDDDSSAQSPKKQPELIYLVVDGKLSGVTAEEMDTLFDEKLRTAFNGLKGDPCTLALEQMGKNMDVALYGIKWLNQSCYEKLETRLTSQDFVLDDIRSAYKKKNFVEVFLKSAGRKLLPRKVIWAWRTTMTVCPYVVRYFFYSLFFVALFRSDVPVCVKDYFMLFIGTHWLTADELSAEFSKYYTYCKSGGKKVGKKDEVVDGGQN